MTCFYCFQLSSDVYHCLCLQASCRRNFSLDVVLLDSLGHSATKDDEVYISGFCIVYEPSPSLIGSFTISYVFNLNLSCLHRLLLHFCMLTMGHLWRTQLMGKLLFWLATMELNMLLVKDQVNYCKDVHPLSSRYLRC